MERAGTVDNGLEGLPCGIFTRIHAKKHLHPASSFLPLENFKFA